MEIDNTDAEGRVILCDALTYAGEQEPALLLDFATLTGAARIALGPDLPALYGNDEDVGRRRGSPPASQQRDPLWRMPLWRPYLRYLTSTIADLANGGPSQMAGSITAALYLERFVPRAAEVGAPGRVQLERQRSPGSSGRWRGAGAAWCVCDVEGADDGLTSARSFSVGAASAATCRAPGTRRG